LWSFITSTEISVDGVAHDAQKLKEVLEELDNRRLELLPIESV